MEKLTEVLARTFEMGGYAAYVWPSFGVAAAVMLALVITSLRSLRRSQKRLSDLQQSAHHEA